MKTFFKEFKEFINKGDVVSMAVGIIIGGAFTAIVTAIVDGLISPLIGIICGGIDFSALGFSVGEAFFAVGGVINAIIKFILTALVLFFIIKGLNKMKKEEPKEEAPVEAAPDPAQIQIDLLTEIRDNLKK